MQTVEIKFLLILLKTNKEIKTNVTHVESCTKMYDLFKEDLINYYNITGETFNNILSSQNNENLFIPFWIWKEKEKNVKELLLNFINNNKDDPLAFTVSLLINNIEVCRCFLTKKGFEISPFCIPIDKITSFDSAKHRIFMSATLSDLSYFSTIFNFTENEIKQSVIIPDKLYDIGERMIICPQHLDSSIDDEVMISKIISYVILKKINALVIVPSNFRSKIWVNLGHKLNANIFLINSENMSCHIQSLRSNQFTGLTLIVNRYDGIDLPGNSCRLVVIDRLPSIAKSFDNYEKNAYSKSERINMDLIQKIEQGMGRGIRSNTDYCGIILMGHNLIEKIYVNRLFRYFSPVTKKQLEMCGKLWDSIDGDFLEKSFELLDSMLNRDENWRDNSRSILVRSDLHFNHEINQFEITIRKAFNEYRKGQIDVATQLLQEFIDLKVKKDDYLLIGFGLYLKAEYENLIDLTKAQQTLLSAYSKNNKLLKPISGVNKNKIDTFVYNQAKQIVNQVNNYKANELIVKIDTLLSFLNFGSEYSHSDFEKGIKELGTLLGFDSRMPELEDKDGGPDNLWLCGNCAFIIECKNEATTDFICKHDISQLLSSIQWLKNKSKNIFDICPIIIHQSENTDKQANVDSSMKSLSSNSLRKFKENVKNFFSTLSYEFNNIDEKKVSHLLNQYKLSYKSIDYWFTKLK